MRGNRAADLRLWFCICKKQQFFFHDTACFESLTKASVCLRVQTDQGLSRSNMIKHMFLFKSESWSRRPLFCAHDALHGLRHGVVCVCNSRFFITTLL